MRILRLSLAGFGPYQREQYVDFEKFADDGIFLITGKTGAGKSSILDAICYALYNSIPRYDGGQQRLRSDYCAPDDPTWVQLDFSVGDTEYRVRRTPAFERPKKNKPGELTTTASSAELFRRVGQTWEGIAAGDRNVGTEIGPIVGLTKEQFLQVILLAQNRFQAFLKAKNDERQDVLRSLFQSQRFDRIEASLVERRKLLELQVQATLDAVAELATQAAGFLEIDDVPAGSDLGWLDAAIDELRQAQAAARADADAADAVYESANEKHGALAAIATVQQRRERASTELARLGDAAPAVDEERAALAAARRAAAVWPHAEAAAAASARLESLAKAEERARTSYSLVTDTDHPDNAAALAAAIDETTRILGSLESAEAEERALPARERELAEADAEVEKVDAAIASASKTQASIPREISDLVDEIGALRVTASGEAPAAQAVERIRAQRDAATLAVGLTSKLAQAEAKEFAASAADADASAAHHTLMQQRLAGHAAELAAELIDGEACAVCGATVHPAPAVFDAEPVTEAHIEQARSLMDERREELSAARTAREAIGRSLAEELARSAGLSVEEGQGALALATAELETARAAGESASTLESKREKLAEDLAHASAQGEQLAAQRKEAAAVATGLRAEYTASMARVVAHRAGNETVVERVAALQLTLDAATALERAIEASEAAAGIAASAERALLEQLTEHDFSDLAAVESARTSAASLAALDARIRAHEASVAAATATLAEPEIVEAPEQPVDLQQAERARALARVARDEALTRSTELAGRVTSASRFAASAKARLAEAAGITAEYSTLRELANVVAGLEPNTRRMRLETYVLAAQLEEIVKAANSRLGVMTGGRFLLEHDDSLAFRNTRSGLGLAILDSHTGRSRPTHSLSGGETFLASLALALGLAEVVTNQSGGITLDTLFIDEGFGSLDADTLEIAMSTLDSLRAGGRTIGLISHVDTMKEQIVAKLRITVRDDGSSEIDA